MSVPAFSSPVLSASSFRGAKTRAVCRAPPVSTTRAALDLVPGIPPGEDARENAPLRYYVPRPKEDYSERSFATPLPVTWAGEVGTIGAADIPPMTKESIAESKLVPEDAASTGAFGDFARLMADERAAALASFDTPDPNPGRATCGESEGRAYVSPMFSPCHIYASPRVALSLAPACAVKPFFATLCCILSTKFATNVELFCFSCSFFHFRRYQTTERSLYSVSSVWGIGRNLPLPKVSVVERRLRFE